MATAKLNTKTEVKTIGITLELTTEEAQAVRNLLGHISYGAPFAPASYMAASRVSSALTSAGIHLQSSKTKLTSHAVVFTE